MIPKYVDMDDLYKDINNASVTLEIDGDDLIIRVPYGRGIAKRVKEQAEAKAIIIRINPCAEGEYKVTWVRDGKTYTDIIFADNQTEAAKIAAEIADCDESIVMFPVTQEEIDMILNEDE